MGQNTCNVSFNVVTLVMWSYICFLHIYYISDAPFPVFISYLFILTVCIRKSTDINSLMCRPLSKLVFFKKLILASPKVEGWGFLKTFHF